MNFLIQNKIQKIVYNFDSAYFKNLDLSVNNNWLLLVMLFSSYYMLTLFFKTFEQTFLIELLNSNKKETIRAFWDLITPDRI